MNSDDRDLGMSSDITRRDFLNGVAVGVTGALAVPPTTEASPLATTAGQAGVAAAPTPAYYPP
jgi:hypothetical protein